MRRIAVLLLCASCSSDGGTDLPPGGGPGSTPEDPVPPVLQPDGILGQTEACKYIDLAISLDDSSSMTEERDSMRDVVFPALAEALQQVGNGEVHIRTGVMDACPYPATFHTRGASGECEFWGEKRWMLSQSPRLIEEFSCVGEIYQGDNQCTGENDDEQPASTIATAMETDSEQFMRDGGLLVGLAITDEDEQPTPDLTAQDVYNRLLAVKGGDVLKEAFLGVGASHDCDGVYGSARTASKLMAVAAQFEAVERGLFWDLCEGRLEDGLAEVVTLIDRACDEFCSDPDGCEQAPPVEPPPDGNCEENNDCPSGEACENGECLPIIG